MVKNRQNRIFQEILNLEKKPKNSSKIVFLAFTKKVDS